MGGGQAPMPRKNQPPDAPPEPAPAAPLRRRTGHTNYLRTASISSTVANFTRGLPRGWPLATSA